jgi:hypothetical protein
VSEEKQLRECSSCQTVNDNSAQFCLECGQKLAPVGRGSAPDEQVPSAPSGRPRLHSPILGGYEDIDDAPRKQEKPKNTAPRAKGAHLRSPLLGGSDADDDDQEVFDDTAMKSSKGRAPQSKPGGKMRSPLFGKSGPSSDDDYEEDFPLRDRNTDRSPFPHRSRPREADPGTPAPQQHAPQQSSGKAHLRSPLLGGSDADDFEEEQFSPPAGRKQQQQPGNSRPQKLKSPMFDRASGSGSYDDYDDEEVDDVDDPNVLRSPLLAAKSRLPQGRTNQNQPRPYPPNDAPQMQQQGAPGMQPGAEQQGYNQQAQQATYSQQQANQQAFGAPQTGQQQPMQQGQQANQLQPQQQIQQPQLAQPPMGQISPQSGQAAFGAQGQNNQPVFAPAPPINPNASANGLQSVTFPGQAGQSNQSPQSAQSNYSGQPNQPNQSAQLDQPYEYGAPGASLPGGPSSPFPSSNQSSQRSTMMESPIQPQQLAPQSPPPTPFAPQSSAPAVQSTKTPIFPTVVSGTTSGASNQLLDDDEFVEHSAVTDLSPLPKPKPAKLGGGRFAQPAPASDDDNDDLSSSHTGRGLPLSAQQPISRKRPGALGAVSDDHDHHPGSNAAAPSTPIMVIFVTGFLGAIAKGYFLFSFWKQFAASMPMLVDQLGQLAIFVGLIIFAMQGSRK